MRRTGGSKSRPAPTHSEAQGVEKVKGRRINSRLARSWIGVTGGLLLIVVGFVLFGLGTAWLTSYPALFASTTAFGEEALGIVVLVGGIVVAIWA